jgi:hypothetical protein
MNDTVHQIMEMAWKRQQDLQLGSWQDVFNADLERFLEKY